MHHTSARARTGREAVQTYELKYMSSRLSRLCTMRNECQCPRASYPLHPRLSSEEEEDEVFDAESGDEGDKGDSASRKRKRKDGKAAVPGKKLKGAYKITETKTPSASTKKAAVKVSASVTFDFPFIPHRARKHLPFKYTQAQLLTFMLTSSH